jgi:hypothetical protein
VSDANHRRGPKRTRRRAASAFVVDRGKATKRGLQAGLSDCRGLRTYDMVLPNRGDAKGRARFKRKRARRARRASRDAS